MLGLCSLLWLPVSRFDAGAFLQQRRDKGSGQVSPGQLYNNGCYLTRNAAQWTGKGCLSTLAALLSLFTILCATVSNASRDDTMCWRR
jgi:hypothetical protein